MVTRLPAEKVPELNVDGTLFSFPSSWIVSVFDEWPQFVRAAGMFGLQGSDVVAIDGSTLWIIEMKDYTYPGAKEPVDLAKVVGQKSAGTLALLHALERATPDSKAAAFAKAASATTTINLALHVDFKDGGRKGEQILPLLMPLQDQLKRVRSSLGVAQAYVTSTLVPTSATPWTARRDPGSRLLHADR